MLLARRVWRFNVLEFFESEKAAGEPAAFSIQIFKSDDTIIKDWKSQVNSYQDANQSLFGPLSVTSTRNLSMQFRKVLYSSWYKSSYPSNVRRTIFTFLVIIRIYMQHSITPSSLLSFPVTPLSSVFCLCNYGERHKLRRFSFAKVRQIRCSRCCR